MGTTSIHVTYRPLRIGFFIRQGDIEGLAKAAMINSLLWGGIFNPVIPVGDDLELCKKLVELFNIDSIFQLEDSIDVDKIYSKYSQIRNAQVIGHLNFLDRAWQAKRNRPYCLDILDIIDHIWNTRTHAWPSDKKGSYVRISWDTADNEANLFAILFGAFPQPDSIFEEAFMKGLHSEEVNISIDAEISARIINKRSLIELTSYRLQGSTTESLYLGKGDSFDDLLNFWNIRAAGIPIVFCNCDKYVRWSSFIKAYLPKLGKRGVVRKSKDKIIRTYYYTLGESEIKKFEESLDLHEKMLKHDLKKHRHIHACVCTLPTIPFLHESTVLGNVDSSDRGYKISLELPPKWFVNADTSHGGLGHFTALLSPITEFEYPMHTIRVPHLKDLTECFGREIAVNPHTAIIQSNSIGRVVWARENSVTLYPIPYDSLVREVFAYRGIKSQISQAGILLKQIVEQLGGLESAWVLKIRGVRKLIKAYMANDSFNKQTAISLINDRGSFKKSDSLCIDPWKNTTPIGAFNFLLKKRLFRSGMELKCANCRLSNWLSMSRINDFWTCEYCGNEQEISTFLTEESGFWRFRKSGLLGKDNNQEGAIPVILTLLQFNRVFELAGLVFSPSMKLTGDNIDSEIDLCIFQYLRHEQSSWHLQSKIEIGIGECKDEGGTIDQNDVQNLKQIYKRLDGGDIRCYLIFSKTADSFADGEIQLFKGLKQDRIPLILFTNKELEPYDPYEELRGQSRHVLPVQTLQEMSWISDSFYLQE